MTNSQNRAGSGCFSGIERLLLCKGSLQTHPSDQIIEPNTKTEFNDFVNKAPSNEVNVKVEATASATPGMVARLMGLDSFPPDTKWVPIPNGRTTPDSVTRSREKQENRVETEETEVGDEEIKQRKKEEKIKKKFTNNNTSEEAKKYQRNNLKISELKNEPRKQLVSNKKFSRFGSCKGAQVSSGFVSPSKKNHRTFSKAKCPMKPMNNMKEVLVESKFMKKIKNHALKDLRYFECSPEDSSPVSVIDHDEFPLSDGPNDTQGSNPEKKCSQKTRNLDNYLVGH